MVPKLEMPPLGMLPVFISGSISNTSQSRHTDNSENKKHVELVIHKSFQNLIRLHVFIFNTCLVPPDPVNSDSALSLGKTASSDRRVRKEDEHDDTPSSAESATKQSQQ